MGSWLICARRIPRTLTKHAGLSIDEILGFIDDCVLNCKCRILLVLNSDKLNDKIIWEQFREKVIDQELRLDTTPAEACDIAFALTPTPWFYELKQAIETCGVTNIRIIRKIIRVANRLLGLPQALPPLVLARVIPSTVLLSAIHYKGLEDGPDFQFVLNCRSTVVNKLVALQWDQGREKTDEDRSHERWGQLLSRLKIAGTDEFEVLVASFLDSGLVDSTKIQKVIQRYLDEGNELVIRDHITGFFQRANWHPEISEQDLVQELHELLPFAGKIDMYAVSALASRADELTGDSSLGLDLVGSWCAAFREKTPDGLDEAGLITFGQALHPLIQAELTAANEKYHDGGTLLDAFELIINLRAWGTREHQFMSTLTADSFEQAIRQASGEDLKVVLFKGMDFYKNPSSYDRHMENVGQAYLEACRNILHHDGQSRLGKLIRKLFKEEGREAELMQFHPRN